MKNHPLHSFFIRIAVKKGRLAAIVATARKLAVIYYNIIVKEKILITFRMKSMNKDCVKSKFRKSKN